MAIKLPWGPLLARARFFLNRWAALGLSGGYQPGPGAASAVLMESMTGPPGDGATEEPQPRPAPGLVHAADDPDQEDRRLLARIAQQRDSAALEQLYGRYRERLSAFLRRLSRDPTLIDEVYNDVMVKIWHKAHQFQGQSRVSSWIYSIAYRDCLRMVKKQHRRDRVIHLLGDEVPEQPVQDDHGEPLIDPALLQRALGRLPPKQRIVLELCYFEGRAIEEIARIVGAPANTVKTRLHYARNKLKLDLGRQGAALDA